jgi:hypothetical protein
VAAFCECCGAEITLRAEACPACGSPQHGMLQPDLPLPFDVDVDPSQEDPGENPRGQMSERAIYRLLF